MATNGIDGGRASVIVPTGYDFEVDAHGGTFKSTTKDGTTTYTTGLLDTPHEFWACFTGDNPAGYATSQFTSPSGRRIELQAWPEDSTWNDEIRTSIDAILTELEGLVGRGLPGSGTIVIREVSSAELGAYAGVFDWSEGIARVGEDSGEVGIVAHELSHAWFNGELFDTTWLSEGYAEWAERSSPTRRARTPAATRATADRRSAPGCSPDRSRTSRSSTSLPTSTRPRARS